MKLFMESILSSASMHESTAAEETPCSWGVLRGSGAARANELIAGMSRRVKTFLTASLQKIGPLAGPSVRMSYYTLHAPNTPPFVKSNFSSSVHGRLGSAAGGDGVGA